MGMKISGKIAIFACSRYKRTQGRDLVANGEAELTEKVKRRCALTKLV